MKRFSLSLFFTGIVLIASGIWLNLDVAYSVAQDEIPVSESADYCTVCHTASSSQVYTFANGNSVQVNVDSAVIAGSVHGDSNPDGALNCTDCHSADAFPHDDPPATNEREYTITKSNVCIDCHTEEADNLADDLHLVALYDGNLRAATCVDCHGAHDIQSPATNPTLVAETCGTCHQIAFQEYRNSIHGEALFEGDENVPTCIDCHGVHGIQHPTTAQFRNRSPEVCEACHGDADLMEEYDLSTNIENSYLSDFHGTTVALFEQNDPGVASNKAVCYDCHGVHDILSVDDENSHVIRSNLLATCRECHPDATDEFPDSWVGHYEPSFETHPLLTMVNIFYAILIPAVVGGFIFLVATDIIRMIRERLSNND